MPEVELNLKEKIIYKSFKTQTELTNEIYSFILNEKSDRIIFKGDPYEINFKLLKKVIDEKNPLVVNGDFRNAFRKILQHCNNEGYCMIYKK
jgi:hypothetical protein